jgi:hypothetical protein
MQQFHRRRVEEHWQEGVAFASSGEIRADG